jgi:FecR protein
VRHLVLDAPRHVGSSKSIGGAVAILALMFAATIFAQQAAIPPPPPDVDPSQPSLQEPPAPDNNVRAVRLSAVEGKVQVFNGTEAAFDQAVLNMPVVEGMRFVTADDGRVEIQFEDGSVARVTPNSSITLAQLSRNPDGATVTTIDANAGLTYYELNGRSGQYSVRFGPNTITPNDSAIFRVALDANPDLAVTHGTVHLTDGQNLALDVHTNESVHFDTQNASQYQVVQSVSADTWDQWNSDRDQALATLEENATTARASTGNPDDAAWNDLDYYGDWYNVPGYGMAWAPSGAGADWDPFGEGSWGYYNTVGYAWISSYPWGWWPYHCGAWNWFGGFGWMWFPGNCGVGYFGGGWYPYAAVWRCPPNYKPPQKPVGLPPHGLPPHHKFPYQPLVAVNRGQQYGDVFRTIGGTKPSPRIFSYDGRNIAPAESTIQVRHGGPIGEGYTAAVVRTHPEVFDRSYVRTVNPGHSYQPGIGTSGYMPGHIPSPPSYRPAPAPMPPRTVYTPPPPSGGVHVSAPPPPAAGGHPR